MSLGKNIRRLREAQGITQDEFSEAMGVSQKTISAWECDVNEPKMGVIVKIAMYLGTDVNSLLEDEMSFSSPVTRTKQNTASLSELWLSDAVFLWFLVITFYQK